MIAILYYTSSKNQVLDWSSSFVSLPIWAPEISLISKGSLMGFSLLSCKWLFILDSVENLYRSYRLIGGSQLFQFFFL